MCSRFPACPCGFVLPVLLSASTLRIAITSTSTRRWTLPGRPTTRSWRSTWRFLTDTRKPLVDKLLRTLPDRLHAAMGGSTVGGISSMGIAWTQWQTFGPIASFSGAYWIGEPSAV